MAMELAIYGFLAPKRRIEPAGISYEYSLIKDKLALGHSTYPVLQTQFNDSTQSQNQVDNLEGTTEWIDEENSKYRKYIAKLDPNHVKQQDHYKVLGLTKLRYKASQNQIKTAYRQKVLKYHPDKGKAVEGELRTESVFACIQKAYEQLGISEEKRKAFDSVDPTFDEFIPDTVNNVSDFFTILAPVFERNARFSINQPVPLLGDENSGRSYVEHFYDFWFDWKSWREFSYLDKEDKTKGEDRWERREIEKTNKVEREKRRKRELKRISTLVELAYCKDPRVARFKEEDRQKKEKMKEQKIRERKEKIEAELEEQKQKELQEKEERRVKEEEERRALQHKQQKKKQLSAQRKRFRELAASANYWTQSINMNQESLTVMEQIERICLAADMAQIEDLCEKLASVSQIDEALRILRECARKEDKTSNNISNSTSNGINNGRTTDIRLWSPTELQLLVKAVNIYPPGTQERWKQVAEYVSYHGGNQRSEKDIIKQVKLFKSDPSSASAPATQLLENGTNSTNIEKKSAETLTNSFGSPAVDNEENWNADQQHQLEKGLKETQATDPERWSKIAAKVEGKTKKECIRRYKKLAEIVKRQTKDEN